VGTIAELRRKIQRKTANVYDTIFTRRVSIYITAAVAPLGVKPNQVSVIAVLVGLAACGLIALGSRTELLVGAALVHLYAVLDSVDGELARLTKNYSLKGLFIEDLSSYLMLNGVNLAIASYLYRTQGVLLPLWLAAFIAAFAHNAMPAARRSLLKSVMTRRPMGLRAGPAAGAPRRSTWMRAARLVIKDNLFHLMTIWATLATVLLVEVLASLRGPVLYAFYFFATGLVLKEVAIYVYLLRGGALEGELRKIYDAAATLPHPESHVDGRDLAEY
jgi:phosphatidylglycerophosphate synthase